MQVGDLVRQRKTVCGGAGPVLLVTAILSDGKHVRVWLHGSRWLLSKANLEVICEGA